MCTREKEKNKNYFKELIPNYILKNEFSKKILLDFFLYIFKNEFYFSKKLDTCTMCYSS